MTEKDFEYVELTDDKKAKHSFKAGGKTWERVKDCPNVARLWNVAIDD